MEKMRHFSDFFTLKEKDNTKHDQVLATEIQIKSENNVPRKKEGVINNYLLRYHSCSFACQCRGCERISDMVALNF